MKKNFIALICLVSMIFSPIYEACATKQKDNLLLQKEFNINPSYEKSLKAFSKRNLNKIPKIFLDQIHEDFVHMNKPLINEKDLEATEKLISKEKDKDFYFRVKIIDRKIYYHTNVDEKDHLFERFRYVMDAISIVNKSHTIPNVDFILYCGDVIYDNLKDFKAPIFVFALNKTYINNKILIPDALTLAERNWPSLYYYINYLNKNIKWDDKISKAIWRGSSTGNVKIDDSPNSNSTFDLRINNYFKFPRVKLVEFSNLHPDLIDAKFVSIVQADDKTKKIMTEKYGIAEYMSKIDQLKYKIQFTIDGNTATYPGLLWRLRSNSVNLKVESDDYQWFNKFFKAGVDYVPVKRDLSDLKEKLEWAISHDKEALKLSKHANKTIDKYLKPTDLYWYMYALLREYSIIQTFYPKLDDRFVEYKSVEQRPCTKP